MSQPNNDEDALGISPFDWPSTPEWKDVERATSILCEVPARIRTNANIHQPEEDEDVNDVSMDTIAHVGEVDDEAEFRHALLPTQYCREATDPMDMSGVTIVVEDGSEGKDPDEAVLPWPSTPSCVLVDSKVSSVLGKRPADPHPGTGGPPKKQRTVDAVILANDSKVERLIRKDALSFGVLFELARLIGSKHITYEDIISLAPGKLKGTNAIACPKVATVLRLETKPVIIFEMEKDLRSPFEELDREAQALSADPKFGCLGTEEWYGGRVWFRATVCQSKSGEEFALQLEHPRLGPSCRLTRRFGSDALLRVKLPERYESELLTKFVKRPLVFWGKIYRALCVKDRTVFYLRCGDERAEDGVLKTIKGGASFHDTIMEINPMDGEQTQLLCKWTSRFSLWLSSSIPGPRLQPENIKKMDDIISLDGKYTMTDGCGAFNRAMQREIARVLKLDVHPTAVQIRVAGYKGMIALRSHYNKGAESDQPQVWLRPSQLKIHYPTRRLEDPDLCVIDILRVSKLKEPCYISHEVMINFSHNSRLDRDNRPVINKVLQRLFAEALKEQIGPLLVWDGEHAMLNLAKNIDQAVGVGSSMRARIEPGQRRLNGYSDEDQEGEDEEEASATAIEASPLEHWPDETSGCPVLLAETVIRLLQAGFTPQGCGYMRELLQNLTGSLIETATQKCRFPVLASCSGFSVAEDTYGVLKENEIQVKSSSQTLRLEDGTMTNILLGDVLITRNPCKLPTDVQKVRAVEHPKLSSMVDVIVMPTKAFRAIMDLLAGGDMDGDTVQVYKDSRLVDNFNNAPLQFADEPPDLAACFIRDETTVGHFFKQTEGDPERRVEHMLPYLLAALQDEVVYGQYSNFHTFLEYVKGYAVDETIKCGWIFGKTMDASKTGYRLKPEVLAKHRQLYSHPKPEWRTRVGKKAKTENPSSRKNSVNLVQGNELCPRRGLGLRSHIMDALIKESAKLKYQWFVKLDTVLLQSTQNEPKGVASKSESSSSKVPSKLLVEKKTSKQPESPAALLPDPSKNYAADRDLTKVWHDGRGDARKKKDYNFLKSMDIIADHVDVMFTKYKKAKSDMRPWERQRQLRELSKEFAVGPSLGSLPSAMDQNTLSRLRASRAYFCDFAEYKDSARPWSRFPWEMAMRDLCAIKAAAVGPSVAVTEQFNTFLKFAKIPAV